MIRIHWHSMSSSRLILLCVLFMKKYLVIILFTFLPSIMWAQLPGGEIKRTVKKKTQRHSQNVVVSKDSRSSNGQNSQTASKAPSKEYMDLFHNVEKDFYKIRNAYNEIKRDGYRIREFDQQVSSYRNFEYNMASLKYDKKNYNLLSDKQKKRIEEFSHLLDDIKRNYHRYPIRR